MLRVVGFSSLWLLLTAGVIAAGTNPESSSPQLSLQIRAEITRIVKGGALKLALMIRNMGPESCWIHTDHMPSSWLHIYDGSGSEVQLRVPYRVVHPPRLNADSFLLKPEDSLTLRDLYSTSELGLRAGKYRAKIDLVFATATEDLAIPACTGWLRGNDEVMFEVIE